MAYKVYVKKLSSYEKKWKQARHERRMAKRFLAEFPRFLTAEQIEEMCSTATADMNTRVGSILKRDHPEAFGLVGSNLFESIRNFSDAQRFNLLKEAMAQCNEEREAFVGACLLSLLVQAERAEPIDASTRTEVITA